jgi:hypothetical protein
MPSIRVLTFNLPDVITDWVHQMLREQSDIDWLGAIAQWKDVFSRIDQVDILILGADDVYSLSESCFQLLGNHPNLRIILLDIAGNQAIVYWRDLFCQQMSIVSSQTLIDSIRQVHSGGR